MYFIFFQVPHGFPLFGIYFGCAIISDLIANTLQEPLHPAQTGTVSQNKAGQYEIRNKSHVVLIEATCKVSQTRYKHKHV